MKAKIGNILMAAALALVTAAVVPVAVAQAEGKDMATKTNATLLAAETTGENPSVSNLQDERYVNWLGRTYYQDGATWFNFSAAGFEVRFYGTSLTANLVCTNWADNVNRPYISVLLDGETDSDYASVFRLTKQNSTIALAEGLTEGYHTLKVYKRSECANSHVGVKSVTTDGKLLPVQKENYNFTMEFYGDSITCGYGVDGKERTDPFSTRLEDSLKTYAYYTASAFNARYTSVSAGGFPLYKSLYSQSYTVDNIPDMYNMCDFDGSTTYENAHYFDNSTYVPDIVVINLGTNDGSWFSTMAPWYKEVYDRLDTGDVAETTALVRQSDEYKAEVAAFRAKYEEFLDNLIEVNPSVEIFCTEGFYDLNPDLRATIEDIVKCYEGDDKPQDFTGHIWYLHYTTQENCESFWPCDHPSVEMHKWAANQLIGLIEEKTMYKRNEEEKETEEVEAATYSIKANTTEYVLGESFVPSATAYFGDEILTATVEADTSNLQLEGDVLTAAGTWQVRYYLQDESGKTLAQKYAKVRVTTKQDTNVVYNGRFDNETKWTGSFTVSNEEANVSDAICQTGIELKENAGYALTFRARGSGTIKISLTDGNGTSPIDEERILTSEGDLYKIVFANSEYTAGATLSFSGSDFVLSEVSIVRENLTGDTEKPVISNVMDYVILPGTTVHFLGNVQVNDNMDGTFTPTLYKDGDIVRDPVVTFEKEGEYTYVYRATDSEGNEAEKTCHVLVTKEAPQGKELISNGDFADGTSNWVCKSYEEAAHSMTVQNGVLAVEIQEMNSYSPRLTYGNFKDVTTNTYLLLEKGVTYTLSFDMWAEEPRYVQMYLSEYLGAAPWIASGYLTYQSVDLTSERQTFSYTFTVTGETNQNVALYFGLGVSYGHETTGDCIATTVYLANVSLKKV